MPWRTKLGALLGAGGLILLAASTAIAAPPSYSITVLKSASPSSVPPSGGTVVFTVAVTGTGSGFLQQVNIDDGMAACTLAGPTGDDGDAKLEQGETWSYTCTVTNVMPNDVNTAVVNACHSAGPCNNAAHDATGQSEVTMGSGPATDAPPTEAPPTEAAPTEAPPTEAAPRTEAVSTEAPPTEAPPTEAPPTEAVSPTEAAPTEAAPVVVSSTEAPPTDAPPTDAPPTEAPPTEAAPVIVSSTEAPPTEAVPGDNAGATGGVGDLLVSATGGVGDLEADASEPATDAIAPSGSGGGPNRTILLVLALGLLLASLVLVTPARPVHVRQRR